jgi:hypothetical protein
LARQIARLIVRAEQLGMAAQIGKENRVADRSRDHKISEVIKC